jgi:hypothetical protein
MFVLANSITGGLKNIKFDMLGNEKINFLSILFNCLNIYNKDFKLFEMLLLTVKSYLLFEEDEMMDAPNSIRNTLLGFGLEGFLEGLSEYPNEKVKDIAVSMLEIIS